ncbi:hypothetical protein SCP_0606370 [Sparassis crispa]|uniref:F-box domain-containing protein n=1 Tax=Sparassis crispa TaxID=139825 RepID=A0A401GR00_9APHY|nr:hypothetical protein SCP_0606370 [Sparassis crispa]GBE84658.1 hypothetical protein SCP_0606370 [Sparassis crispa]
MPEDTLCRTVAQRPISSISPSPTSEPPVNRLPNEILGEIFVILRSLDYSNNISPVGMAWLRVTFVCQYWRGIALGMPSLWSSIDVTRDLEFCRLYLQRSQNTLIDIHYPRDMLVRCRCSTHNVTGIIVMVLPHAHRIRTLELGTMDKSHLLELFAALTIPMPHMEALELLRDDGWDDLTPFNPPRDQFPALRSIALNPACIAWSSPLLSRLTNLELYYRTSDKLLSMNTFLDMIQASPDLQSLVLWHAGPNVGASKDTRIVSLPQLRVIHLEDTSRTISSTLAHLAIPARAFLKIRILAHREFGHPLPDLIHDIFPPDTSALDNLKSIRHVNLTGEHNHFSISAFDGPGGRYQEDMRLRVYVTYNNIDLSPLVPTALPALAAMFGPSVVGLNVEGEYDLTEEQWRDTLTCWPDLEYIHVLLGGDVRSLFEALRLPPVGFSTGIPSPRLKDILVCRVSSGSIEHSFRIIIACLEARLAQGTRLEELTLRDGLWTDNPGDGFKAKMETLVGKYCWDVRRV